MVQTIILGKPINLNPTDLQRASGKFRNPIISLNTRPTEKQKRTRRRLEKTVVGLGVTAATLGTIAFPGFVLGTAKTLGRVAIRNPIKTLFGIGLAGTPGGRQLLINIPKTIRGGGEALGKVVGGEPLGFDAFKDALFTAGLVGTGLLAGKKILDLLRSRGETAIQPLQAPISPAVGVASTSQITSPLASTGGIPQASIPGSPQSSISSPVVAELPKEIVPDQKQKPINIKIKNNPQINIAIAV